MSLYHESLLNYYNMNFALMQHHRWSLNEIEGMIPWEKDIYVSLLMGHLEREREKNATKNKTAT